MNFKGKMREKSGITLITLAVTIIILLILAGITIATITSDNGIIKNANDAKEQTEIAEEKEILDISSTQAMGKDKYGNLNKTGLENTLNNNAGENKTEVIDNGDSLVVKFVDSERYYEVDSNGNVSDPIEIIVDNNPGNIKIDINGESLTGLTEESAFEIWCIEDLVEWSQNYSEYQNSYIKLCRTLNFNSSLSYTDGKVLNCNSIEELKELLTDTSRSGFTPIASFRGKFDGQENEIQNIYIVNSGNVGLFRQVNGATICNLGISGYIESTGTSNIHDGIGGIVGHVSSDSSKSNIIENCWNKAKIKGILNNQYTGIGGILGQARHKVEIVNCYNDGEIIGKIGEFLFSDIGVGIGGILGFVRGDNADVNVYNSYNLGNISSNKFCCGIVGGIWAEGLLNIENCINMGETKTGICRTAVNISSNNIYYLNNKSTTGGINNAISVSEDEIQTEQFINILNDYIDEETYKRNWNTWKLGERGYPILSFQNE